MTLQINECRVGDRVRFLEKKFPDYAGSFATIVGIASPLIMVLFDGYRRAEGWYPNRFEIISRPIPLKAAATELSHKERKQRPVLTGVLDYFPDAIREVAYCSFICNEQHNPGQPMHWAKDKSIGQGDEIVRHLMDRKKHKRDTDNVRVLAKASWRMLELLQREIEEERATAAATHTASTLATPTTAYHEPYDLGARDEHGRK